jgi:hypothetical protein
MGLELLKFKGAAMTSVVSSCDNPAYIDNTFNIKIELSLLPLLLLSL